jgi:DNA-binding CsgD family transcriptional regulator
LTSDAVAGRLFLSVRTVDNHMQHVYQKLGIVSRTELAAALRIREP